MYKISEHSASSAGLHYTVLKWSKDRTVLHKVLSLSPLKSAHLMHQKVFLLKSSRTLAFFILPQWFSWSEDFKRVRKEVNPRIKLSARSFSAIRLVNPDDSLGESTRDTKYFLFWINYRQCKTTLPSILFFVNLSRCQFHSVWIVLSCFTERCLKLSNFILYYCHLIFYWFPWQHHVVLFWPH